MELERLIEQLSRPSAYTHPTGAVEIRQTHVSVVFLAGDYAYKIKKPVNLGFLDFTGPETRRRVCHEEVRLNRRLAGNVYVGVVPVVKTPHGLAVFGDGETVEWAVKMRRLPDDASLLAAFERGELTHETLRAVAERMASFHRTADRGPAISAFGRYDVVAGNARENFDQSMPEVGKTVSQAVFAELRALTERHLVSLRQLIDRRAERGIPCDGHGDLRLEHIYSFPSQMPPDDLVIIDCLEYGERFRFADPVSDVAFAIMELVFFGMADAARSFAEAYLRASGDEEAKQLLPFYVAYRSIVRAKVRGLELRAPEIPEERRARSLVKAKAHFLLALGVLAEPARRPALVLVGGLPGTGKSTLAQALAEHAGFELIRSDVVRKELAGLSPFTSSAAEWQAGIYSREATIRTYDECRKRASALLFEGKRVVVDATFPDEALRAPWFAAARALSVPLVWLVCETSPEQVRARLASRRGDASDADFDVYERARREWEPAGPASRAALVAVNAEDRARALDEARAALRERALV